MGIDGRVYSAASASPEEKAKTKALPEVVVAVDGDRHESQPSAVSAGSTEDDVEHHQYGGQDRGEDAGIGHAVELAVDHDLERVRPG